MINEAHKNWNNFFLGLSVVILPWLGLPLGLKKVIFVILGLLIALFSLARVGRVRPTSGPTASANEPTPTNS